MSELVQDENRPRFEAPPTALPMSPPIAPPTTRPVVLPVEPRWPGIMALLTAWWLPATTARRTQHVPLLNAFGVHILCCVPGCLLLMIMVAWEDSGRIPGRTLGTQFWRLVEDILRELGRGLNRWPAEMIAAIVGVVLLIEAGFVALALLLSPWGAADEKLRTSMANGLRHVWLHTADALPVFLVVGLIAVPLFHVQRDWYAQINQYRVFENPPTAPVRPANLKAGSPEMQDYTQKQEEYNEALTAYYAKQNNWWQERYATRPWLVRYGEFLAVGAFMLGGVWVLWAMVRAVGAWRPVPAIVRPPTCESCGYNLTMMPLEARCPECGIPVMESLGPDVRPGAPWEHRHELGRLAAWWRTGWEAAARPAWLGSQVRVGARVTDHRRFLVTWFPVLFAIGYWMAIGFEWADRNRNPFVHSPEIVYGVGPVLGIFVATLALFGPLAAAAVAGCILSLGHRRNLVPAAMQVGAYLSGLLTLFALISAALGVAVFKAAQDHWLEEFQTLLQIDNEVLAFFGWAVPSFVLVLVYFSRLYRGTRGAGHANR